VTISTVNTDRLYASLLQRILTFTDADQMSLATSLGNRIYRHQPPPDAQYPYGLFSLKSPQLPADYQELKIVYQLEGFVINRPRATQPETEGWADLWAAALRGFTDAGSGLTRVSDVVTESLPPFPSPADANVVQVRITAKLQVFPLFIAASKL
jgi:hypothetical protein